MKYMFWIPSVILWYMFYYIMSKINNSVKSIWIFILMMVLGACPFWAIVSRSSKNLVFDGMLYDITMFLTMIVTFSLLGVGKSFAIYQWIGLVLVFVGFILMRIGV